MKCKTLYILMGIALAVGNASSLGAWQSPYDPNNLFKSIPDWEEIDPERAYTENRWIGLRRPESSACPEVTGWSEESWLKQVLTNNDLQVAGKDRDLLQDLGLDRLCVYTRDAGSTKDFIAPAGLAASKDRMALAARADDLGEMVGPELARHFLAQAGGPPVALAGAPSVRLTFIDSQPDGEGAPSTPPVGSQHGYTLAHLARALVCPADAPCAVEIASRRALSYDRFQPDGTLLPLPASKAGHLGLVSDLAQAIVVEVLHWRKPGSPRHLILNLSLGWDGELLHKLKHDLKTRKVEELEPSVQAVYNALRFARKSGVLVIAAAGNRRGGQTKSNWPLLPAAWELRRPSFLPFAFCRKPVYAVGGVDWQGLPLPNARSGGHPRRVAYGDHAVADVGSKEQTAILTGSSVSTAVVSSVAAAVWHLRPELQPAEVLRLIGRSGDPLETRADFYAWRKIWPLSWLLPAPETRRVSLCKAVKQACGDDAARCPALIAARQCPPWERRPPAISSSFPSIVTERRPAPWPTEPLQAPCESGLWSSTNKGGASDRPCLTDRFVSVATGPWTLPQPGENPCSGCSLVQPPYINASLGDASDSAAVPRPALYDLKFQIEESWRSTPPLLERAVLEIDCSSVGRGRTLYEITLNLEKSGLQTVIDLGDGQTLHGCRGRLDFAVFTNGEWISVQSPVVVDP